MGCSYCSRLPCQHSKVWSQSWPATAREGEEVLSTYSPFSAQSGHRARRPWTRVLQFFIQNNLLPFTWEWKRSIQVEQDIDIFPLNLICFLQEIWLLQCMTFVHNVASFRSGECPQNLPIQIWKSNHLLEYSNPKQHPFSIFDAQLRQSEAQSARLWFE